MKDVLGIPDDEFAELQKIEERYPVCIPAYYLDLVDPDDPNDPIHKMCVPLGMEFPRVAARTPRARRTIRLSRVCSTSTIRR